MAAKPNLEIIKVTNPDSIKEIEKAVDNHNDKRGIRRMKRHQSDTSNSVQEYQRAAKQKPSLQMMQHSKLLSALSGQRYSNTNLTNRLSSPLFSNKDSTNYRN